MEKEIIVSAQNLSIGYRNKGENTPIHTNLDFTLRRGELTSLLGPNGAGKSTLMRSISHLQPTLSGTITLSGKELSNYNEKELSRTIGIILTDKTQTGGLTVNELVALGRQPYTGFFGRLSKQDKVKIDSSIQAVGLSSKKEAYMAELSDGERQKAMIAKTLVQECPLILLDEPTAFLDAASRIEITQLLHEIAQKENRAILLSTHDIEQALVLSDKIWLLTQQGLTCGTPEDLVLNHQMDTLFEGKNVRFDKQRGSFSPTLGYQKQIFVTASEESLLHWGVNAINRLGIGQASTPQGHPQLQFLDKNRISYKGEDGKETTFTSFEEMTKTLAEF